MALSCVWACAAAPTAREAISTALHRKAVLDIASSSVTKFESTVWQMPICLRFLRLTFEALCTITPLPARYPHARCRRGVEAIGQETAEPLGIRAPRPHDNFTTSPWVLCTRNRRACSSEIGDVLKVMTRTERRWGRREKVHEPHAPTLRSDQNVSSCRRIRPIETRRLKRPIWSQSESRIAPQTPVDPAATASGCRG